MVITSARKATILQQIPGLKIVIKNKDDSNLESILDMFSGVYGVIDKDNIKGDLADKIFKKVNTRDITTEVLELLLIKEQSEIDYIFKSGIVANYLLQHGIDLLRDAEFSKDSLEAHMDDRIRGIDNSLIEFSFDPEFSPHHLRLGVRYRGYSTEIARRFLDDLSAEYDIQKHVISLVRPGEWTSSIMLQLKGFLDLKGYTHCVQLYTVGLMWKELGFETDFKIQNGMCFCLNIGDSFCNTFVVNDILVFVTKKDTKEDYSATKMRFRNKNNDAQVISKIKDHQKELLEALIEEKINFYRTHDIEKIPSKSDVKAVSVYMKDSLVPRSERLSFDWDNFFVLIPILSYSIPFHISTIKNVSVVTPNEEPRLRINFKESKEIKETLGAIRDYDTKIKFITLRCGNVEDLVGQVNEMRKEFNKPKIALSAQPVLKEKLKKYGLSDVYMRTDNKGANKKILGNLELHENGFKYNSVNILFSNIKNIFFQTGDMENRTILHFNLKEPILFVKPTLNVQFFKQFTVAYHDTSKREGEEMELMHEREEEERLCRINAEFGAFVERIEQETSLKVQIPEKAFLGVHSREAVQFYLTNDCLVSIYEHPFFVLNFDDVEVVSFERITFVTKTFDCVFVFHDRTRQPITVGSIETTKLAYIKEMLDSYSILFMENKVNINWSNLMHTIMEDPLSFYENGAWSELLREEEESESESEKSEESSSSAYTEDDDEDDTTSYDAEEEHLPSNESSEDDDSYIATDSEDEAIEEDTESSDDRPKKRKSRM